MESSRGTLARVPSVGAAQLEGVSATTSDSESPSSLIRPDSSNIRDLNPVPNSNVKPPTTAPMPELQLLSIHFPIPLSPAPNSPLPRIRLAQKIVLAYLESRKAGLPPSALEAAAVRISIREGGIPHIEGGGVLNDLVLRGFLKELDELEREVRRGGALVVEGRLVRVFEKEGGGGSNEPIAIVPTLPASSSSRQNPPRHPSSTPSIEQDRTRSVEDVQRSEYDNSLSHNLDVPRRIALPHRPGSQSVSPVSANAVGETRPAIVTVPPVVETRSDTSQDSRRGPGSVGGGRQSHNTSIAGAGSSRPERTEPREGKSSIESLPSFTAGFLTQRFINAQTITHLSLQATTTALPRSTVKRIVLPPTPAPSISPIPPTPVLPPSTPAPIFQLSTPAPESQQLPTPSPARKISPLPSAKRRRMGMVGHEVSPFTRREKVPLTTPPTSVSLDDSFEEFVVTDSVSTISIVRSFSTSTVAALALPSLQSMSRIASNAETESKIRSSSTAADTSFSEQEIVEQDRIHRDREWERDQLAFSVERIRIKEEDNRKRLIAEREEEGERASAMRREVIAARRQAQKELAEYLGEKAKKEAEVSLWDTRRAEALELERGKMRAGTRRSLEGTVRGRIEVLEEERRVRLEEEARGIRAGLDRTAQEQ